MPSSTSSSRLLGRCVAIFAATFVASVALSSATRSLPALRNHQVLEAVTDPPASADYYQVSDTELYDQHVFFHEIYPVREALDAADVLLLGNSRMMVGLPHAAIGDFFRERDLRYYHLGFADARAEFARILIEKYDPKARLVVVNADWFFVPGVSHWSERAMRDSRFDALKLRFELGAKFRARGLVHRLLPHPIGRDLDGSLVLGWRSISRGDWIIQWNQSRSTGVNRIQAPPYSAPELSNARAFAAELEKRGMRLVLTWVPWRIDGRDWVIRLAKEVGVPVILPSVRELQTIDGSHLDPASAQRFSKAFLAELEPYL